MDKAPAYGAGDSGFESQYGLYFFDSKRGVMRESNSRPPAPEAGIIPLDQSPTSQKKRDVLDLNQRPAGLQPAGLPLS
jgi:hypothetical protein